VRTGEGIQRSEGDILLEVDVPVLCSPRQKEMGEKKKKNKDFTGFKRRRNAPPHPARKDVSGVLKEVDVLRGREK